MSEFDFGALQRAIEQKNVPAWLDHFAEDAEWREYRPGEPVAEPRRLIGRDAIRKYLAWVAADPITLRVRDPVIAGDRVAFVVDCVLGDGRRGLEHVFLYLRDGRIVRQVDVEAWDGRSPG